MHCYSKQREQHQHHHRHHHHRHHHHDQQEQKQQHPGHQVPSMCMYVSVNIICSRILV